MDDDWHVSNSEDEQETDEYTEFMVSNLKGLSTTVTRPLPASNSAEILYIPKNLIALYKQIENDGFIALQCKGSKRIVETTGDESHSNDSLDNHTSLACNNISNKCETAITTDEPSSTVKASTMQSEFDYDEELMDTTVRIPKRKHKPEHNKTWKTKRVGTMEKVINDLNRFQKLNAQAMAADSTQE